jgi:hypothetical protein
MGSQAASTTKYNGQDASLLSVLGESGCAVIRCALGPVALAIIVPGLVAFSLFAFCSEWISRRGRRLEAIPLDNSDDSTVLFERPSAALSSTRSV